MIAKSDTESSNTDDDSNSNNYSDTKTDHDNDENILQMAALLVKSFINLSYKDFKKEKSFSEKAIVPQTLIKGIREKLWEEVKVWENYEVKDQVL